MDGRKIVYVEVIVPDLTEPASFGRVHYWLQRDFPWAVSEGWEVEWWGIRTRDNRKTSRPGFRVRGPRLPFNRFPRIGLVLLAWTAHLLLALRESGGSIVVTRSPHLGTGIAMARRLRRTAPPLVVRIVERTASKALHLYGARRLFQVLDAADGFVLRRASLVFTLGSFTRELAIEKGAQDRNIIELASPAAWGDTQQGGAEVARNPARVVFAGRLHREKGVDVLINAFALIHKEAPDAVLEVAGEGPERKSLEALAKRLGVADAIRFRGWLPPESMPEFLSGALVAVLPSRVEEGHGRALQEAALSGCALVGSDLGGIKDIVVDGRTGWLVPPEEPTSLARAMSRLLGDPEEARRLGAAARIEATAYYERREAAVAELRRRMYELVVDSADSGPARKRRADTEN
jgi:glycosyltransferase involved in cell wall biosynthesis